MAVVMRGELRFVRVEAGDVRRRPAIERRHEPLLRSRHRSRSALVARRSSGGQHAIREAQHLRRRAEIALQPHDPGIRVSGGEARQVIARGPGERVDRLVLVADDREVIAAAEPGVEQRLLERVRVLVLVDREPSIARPDLGRDSLVALDQLHGHRQHVLEVDEPGPVAGGLVVPIEASHEVRRQRAVVPLRDDAIGVARGCDPACLRPLDLGREVPDGQVSVPAGQRPRQRHEQRRLRREDPGQVAVVDAWPEMPELTQGRRMERERRDASPPSRRQAIAHLRRGLVREGHDQDVGRPDWRRSPGRTRPGA